MGKHSRFRLSAMMPNAWLYKLREMTKVRGRESAQSINSSKTSHPPKPKQPYYYPEHNQHLPLFSPKSSDTHLPIHPPSKSSNTRPKKTKPLIKPSSTTKLITSSVSAGCRNWSSDISVHHRKLNTTDIIIDVADGTKSNSKLESSFYQTLDHFETCELRPVLTKPPMKQDKVVTPPKEQCKRSVRRSPHGIHRITTDIIADIAGGSKSSFHQTLDHFETDQLPPVLTKPPMKEDKVVTPPKEQCKSPARRSPRGIQRIRLRASSPRLASKRAPPCRARRSSAGMQQGRGLQQSLAIMLWSSDPQRDFRDSMVEMIVENDIRASKDLEDLLACYLSLNSKEYHDVIVKVFEQIWFDLTDIRL